MQSVLGESDVCDTLVFDEVDAGVGGATAAALQRFYAAKTHQVIVVTHLPQVGRYGLKHYVVSKTEEHNALPTSLQRFLALREKEEMPAYQDQ